MCPVQDREKGELALMQCAPPSRVADRVRSPRKRHHRFLEPAHSVVAAITADLTRHLCTGHLTSGHSVRHCQAPSERSQRIWRANGSGVEVRRGPLPMQPKPCVLKRQVCALSKRERLLWLQRTRSNSVMKLKDCTERQPDFPASTAGCQVLSAASLCPRWPLASRSWSKDEKLGRCFDSRCQAGAGRRSFRAPSEPRFGLL
jgi:hypothetical protein